MAGHRSLCVTESQCAEDEHDDEDDSKFRNLDASGKSTDCFEAATFTSQIPQILQTGEEGKTVTTNYIYAKILELQSSAKSAESAVYLLSSV